MIRSKDALFIALVFAVILFSFWDLFTLKMAFLSGDHREQQYPWAFFLQQCIHQGTLPWWTSHIHSGFPILAEGQIGALYPFNLLFLAFLPIKIAYNYGILFHYILGGLFFYGYLRHIKRTPSASFFGTLIFLFGSTQGGYFYYNYICQKVVIWLPIGLYLCDILLQKSSWRASVWLGVILALMVLGGYLQVAVYTISYVILYFGFFWFRTLKLKTLGQFAVSGLLGLSLSASQILATFELAQFSSRAHAAKEIAFIGSMTPLGFLTLLYPSWDGFLGSEWYIGLMGLFFLLWAIHRNMDIRMFFFTTATIFFLLLALGEWSPLYRALIDLSGFHSFRTPIKFLFFVTFSCAILAAYGYDTFFSTPKENIMRSRRPALFQSICFFALIIPWGTEYLMKLLQSQLVPLFQKFITDHYFGKPGHPYSLEYYQNKAAVFYQSVMDMLSCTRSLHTRIEMLLLIVSILVISILIRLAAKKQLAKILCIGFLLIDLFRYGFTSIKPNYELFDSTHQESQISSQITARLVNDSGLFRITELYTEKAGSSGVRFPIYPSQNMLYGLDDAGAYSPLIMKKYKEWLGGWGGYINDSLSITWVDPEKTIHNLHNLAAINVKYLISPQELFNDQLRLVQREHSFFLYELLHSWGRAFFSKDKLESPNITSQAPAVVNIEKYQQGEIYLQPDFPENGWLQLSEIYYPSWNAYVDGKMVPIQKWNEIFMAIPIHVGNHNVVFKYEPLLYQYLTYIAGGIFLFILLCTLLTFTTVLKKHTL